MKTKMCFVFILIAISGCATFRDACKTEQVLVNQYGRDIDRCADDLRRYSNRHGRDWIEIGDRVYINSNGR